MLQHPKDTSVWYVT